MALKTERPAGAGDDRVVAFVARRLEEARRARDGLEAEGVACDMPDAALEVLFADGPREVPVRVAAADFSRAVDVIDRLFPPAPDPHDAEAVEPVEPPLEEAGPPDVRASDAEAPAHAEARREAAARRFESAAGKLAVIGGGSLFVPLLGAAFAAFAVVVAGVALLRFGRRCPPKARRRLGLALALGLASVAWNGALIWAWLGG